MALQPNIILSGAQPDILGAMSRGNELAAQTNTLRDQNALRQVYQTQGAGLLQGNRQSLNALAGIDPFAAANMQGAVLQNQTAQRQFEIMNAQEKRAIAEAARTMDEAQKAAALEATKREVFRFLAAPDAATFDQLVTQAGKPELVGQFERRQVLAADYVSSVEEALALGAGPSVDPIKGAPTGYKWADPANPAAGVVPLPGYERSSGVTVNTGSEVGSIPQGYELYTDPATGGRRLRPIPGGPEDKTKNQETRQNLADTATRTVMSAANRALEAASNRNFGAAGTNFVASLPLIGGATDSGETVRQVNVLKAQASIENIQQMRQASPTGGALGGVTEGELKILADKSGALDPESPNFERDLADYALTLLETIHGVEAGRQIFRNEWSGPLPDVLSGAPAAPSANIPPGAIELLRQNNTPDYRRSFDEVFGPGSAARVLGGN